MLKKSVSPSGKLTIAFMFFYFTITAVAVSLRRLYTNSICSIFPLCIESNALEKSTNCSVVSKCFARIPLMIQRIVKIYQVVERFLCKNKTYVIVVLCNSEVTFLQDEKDAAFLPFLCDVSFINSE